MSFPVVLLAPNPRLGALCTALLLLLSFGSARGQQPSGPLAWYKFDGNTTDACGQHPAIGYEPIAAADRFGSSGAAIYFRTNDYVAIADAADLHLQQLSITIWIQADPASGTHMIFSKDDGQRGIQFFLSASPPVYLAWFGLGDGSWHNLQFAATLVPGQWHHLAATYDGQVIRTYVDGQPAGTLAFSGTIVYGTREFEVGRNTYLQTQYFGGALDDLRIYDRVLSASEIQALAAERPGMPFQLTRADAGTNVGPAVSWPSWLGWSYEVQITTDLGASNWSTATGAMPLNGNGVPLSWTNTVAGNSQLFCRVVATKPPTAWAGGAALPLPKADLTVASCNGKIYAMGGYNMRAIDPRGETLELDSTTGVWTRKADMPTTRWGPIAVEFNGRIYVFGGQGTSGTNKNELYDPLTDSWQTKAPTPSGLAAQGLMGVRVNDRIHLFYRSTHYEYDPLTDTYALKTGMPTPRTWGTCAAVSNRIYVIGGYCAGVGATNSNEVYDAATDSWTVKAPLPVSKYGVTRENPVISGKIYVTHGRDGPFFTSNYAYDPDSDTWSQKAAALHPRDGVGCCVLNRRLFVLGGRADNSGPYGLIDHEVYDPSTEP